MYEVISFKNSNELQARSFIKISNVKSMRPGIFKNKIYYHLIFETIFDRLKSMPGNWSDTQPANSDTQTLIDQAKSEVEKKENYPLPPYKAISFKSQVVAGMNFIVKVHVNTDKCIVHTSENISSSSWKRYTGTGKQTERTNCR